MSVRELIGALSALEDARRQYEGRSVAERRVARRSPPARPRSWTSYADVAVTTVKRPS